MNDERCDRDRVTAILTLAEAATPGLHAVIKGGRGIGTVHPSGPGTFYAVLSSEKAPDLTMTVDGHDKHEVTADVAFIVEASKALPDVAAALLEALGTIDRVNALFAGGPDTSCRTVWDGEIECVSVPIEDLRQALDGGNESGDDR